MAWCYIFCDNSLWKHHFKSVINLKFMTSTGDIIIIGIWQITRIVLKIPTYHWNHLYLVQYHTWIIVPSIALFHSTILCLYFRVAKYNSHISYGWIKIVPDMPPEVFIGNQLIVVDLTRPRVWSIEDFDGLAYIIDPRIHNAHHPVRHLN